MLGHLEWQRFDRHLAQRLREHAALAHAGRIVGAVQLEGDGRVDRLVEADFVQVDVRDMTAELVHLVVLEDRRVRAALAVDLDVEDGVQPTCAGQRTTQFALLDADRMGLLSASVEDAGDHSFTPQAPCVAGSPALALAH